MLPLHRPPLLVAAVFLGSCAIAIQSEEQNERGLDDSVERVVLEGGELSRELTESPVRTAPTPFRRVGVRWTGADPNGFEVSFSSDGETWSRWRPIAVYHTEAEDQIQYVGAVEVSGGKPATRYRLRATRRAPPSRVALSFFARPLGEEIEVGVGAAAPSSSRSSKVRSLGSVEVLPRSAWGAKSPSCTSGTHQPKRVTIHHTDGSNSSSNPEAELRGIQADHQGTRGWCDIGYHFLISQDGRIWEGRPVERSGAHVKNNNTDNIGISLMGSFVAVPPTEAQLNSAARLVWALSQEYGFSIDNVRGHGDYRSTECPGSRAYEQIPTIVSRASGEAGGGSSPDHCHSDFGTAQPIPQEIRDRMIGRTWHEGIGCPSLGDLTLLRMPHWGFDGEVHQGEMIVASSIAHEVRRAFDELYEARFPIQRMRLAHEYDGDDDASMADNNTSAFNCRRITGGTALSKHSYGTAIDINPVQNPYVKGNQVLPPSGSAHLNRDDSSPGLIVDSGPAMRAFEELGWSWGGDWTSLKDYQHFESEGAPSPACSDRKPADRVAVRGFVYAAGDAESPIEGATVQLGAASATTDARGLYEISVEPGTHEVVASATGYMTGSISRTVGMSGEAVAWASIGLSPASATTGTGVIRGRVHRGTSARDTVAGATVFIDGSHMTTTDDSGLYTLERLSPGTHRVTATAAGIGSGAATQTVADGEVAMAHIALTSEEVEPPQQETPSCSNHCGSKQPPPGGSECYCDERCVLFDDCCPDQDTVCGPTAPTGSCEEQCFSPFPVFFGGGECYCDSACDRYGDCCGDFEQVCSSAPPPSCSGLCGSSTSVFGPDGVCYCDPVCSEAGDCCGDYEAVCR